MLKFRRIWALVWGLFVGSCNRSDHPAGPVPTAPPLPLPEFSAPPSPDQTVLFLPFAERWFPFFCHQGNRRMWANDCAKLFSSKTDLEILFSDGSIRSARLLGKSDCSWAGQAISAFALLRETGKQDRIFSGIWSDSARPVLHVPPVAERLPETPSEQRYMKAACAQLGAKDAYMRIEPLLSWDVDLDADGVRERILEMRCPSKNSEGRDIYALLYSAGRHPERTVLLRAATSGSAVVSVTTVSDVDGDGYPEVVVRTATANRTTFALSRLTSAGLLSLGEARCETHPSRE